MIEEKFKIRKIRRHFVNLLLRFEESFDWIFFPSNEKELLERILTKIVIVSMKNISFFLTEIIKEKYLK